MIGEMSCFLGGVNDVSERLCSQVEEFVSVQIGDIAKPLNPFSQYLKVSDFVLSMTVCLVLDVKHWDGV